MAAIDYAVLAFNRGIVSKLGLARTDVKRIGMAAETQANWIPRVLGAMSLRPGFAYLGATNSNAAARYVPFVFSTSDTALVEFTDQTMRVWINDAPLSRVAVSTAITNGTFSGSITGWTDGSDSGGAIAWNTGNYMKITGNGTARGIGYQAVSVAAADQAKEHGLHIVVGRGPVTLRVGSSATDDSLVSETVLDTGVHSIAFTPNAATFYVQFQTTAIYGVLVQSCVIEGSGTVTIASPYRAADLNNIRADWEKTQSGDIVFVACSSYQQRKIERRGTRPGARSWSLCIYHADDGPFYSNNITPTTITASGVTGDITLTASRPLFKSTHVGALFSLSANQAQQTVNASAQNTFTSPSIKVTGTGAQRALTVNISGTWVATVTLQQSIGVDGSWSDVASYTTNQTALSVNDGLNNQIVYYRIGIKTGNYTSGTATCQINYAAGSQTGIARITSYQSSTLVNAQVLSALGGTSATSVWAEGMWSDYRGWPTAAVFYEGRLWWFGQNGIWGSVSDSFYSFDANTLGDSGPINRSIGAGPVDTINWALPLQRLIIGSQGAEHSVRSTTFDEPLTPSNFNIKVASTQGSYAVSAEKIDSHGVFVQRGGARIFELIFDPQTYEYTSTHLTQLCPEIGLPGIVRLDIQRQPDTRIHAIRSDGTAIVGVYDKVENVLCWITVTAGGTPAGVIEDVAVLPAVSGNLDDQVYYVVKRVINGVTVRYLEKWALETDCRGGTLNKQGDAFVVVTNSPAATTVAGLSHLEGQQVVVWADGADVGTVDNADGTQSQTYTVSGGRITLSSAAASIMVGLPYTAQYQSVKLASALAAGMGSALGRYKRIDHLGIVATDVHAKGLKYGPDFSTLDNMPGEEEGGSVSANAVRSEYDEQPLEFMGTWSVDARLCLQASAPRPATLTAAIVHYQVQEGEM